MAWRLAHRVSLLPHREEIHQDLHFHKERFFGGRAQLRRHGLLVLALRYVLA